MKYSRVFAANLVLRSSCSCIRHASMMRVMEAFPNELVDRIRDVVGTEELDASGCARGTATSTDLDTNFTKTDGSNPTGRKGVRACLSANSFDSRLLSSLLRTRSEFFRSMMARTNCRTLATTALPKKKVPMFDEARTPSRRDRFHSSFFVKFVSQSVALPNPPNAISSPDSID